MANSESFSFVSRVTLLAVVSMGVHWIPMVNGHHVVTQISVYYETLCSDSQRFFLKQLVPTFEKLNRYMDLELVPFGNANVSYPRHDNRPVFHCQHGPAECYGNRAQACVIDLLKDPVKSISYIKCMFEQSNWENTNATVEKCALTLGLDWPKIETCTNGHEGERLLIANSLKTFNLSPEHTSIPWIVIDKMHTEKMQQQAENHLLKYLCDNHFNHDPLIAQCKEEALQSSRQLENGSTSVSDLNSKLILVSLVTAVIGRILVT